MLDTPELPPLEAVEPNLARLVGGPPGPPTGTPARRSRKHLDDALSAGVDEPAPELSKPRPPKVVDGLPAIPVRPDQTAVAREAAQALTAEPNLYERHAKIVHLTGVPADTVRAGLKRFAGSPLIVETQPALLTALASKHAAFIHFDKRRKGGGEWVRGSPPPWLANVLLQQASQNWPFRHLAGVIQAPTLREDGTVLDRPGYDGASGLLYVSDGTRFPPIPEHPTLEQARAALDVLREMVAQFPFEHEHDRAAALAAAITPVVRPAIAGSCPLFLFDATTPGSGKTLLANLVSLVALGRPCALMSQPERSDGEETRKRITSLLLGGDTLACLDNLTAPLGDGALDVALTGAIWADRTLGSNREIKIPMRLVFLATGNNVQLRGDAARRVVRCRLAPNTERPEERTGFQHPRLLEWAKDNRPRLVASVLTLVRGYVVAGKPSVGLPALGSFEDWSGLVRSALVWAGEADCCEGRAELQAEADPKVSALRALLECWHAAWGTEPVTLQDVAKAHANRAQTTICGNAAQVDARTAFFAAAAELAPPSKADTLDTTRLGHALKRYRGRVMGNLRLEKGQPTRTNTATWTVLTSLPPLAGKP
jgi:hypothetical protein